MICSKFITFAVTKTTIACSWAQSVELWFAQNSLPLRWQRQHQVHNHEYLACCDLLKIHYLCGDKDNIKRLQMQTRNVVICSKFITFAVTKTTVETEAGRGQWLWFAQNSLPLRWQRQLRRATVRFPLRCDLLKIHYLCGDKDNKLVNIHIS